MDKQVKKESKMEDSPAWAISIVTRQKFVDNNTVVLYSESDGRVIAEFKINSYLENVEPRWDKVEDYEKF